MNWTASYKNTNYSTMIGDIEIRIREGYFGGWRLCCSVIGPIMPLDACGLEEAKEEALRKVRFALNMRIQSDNAALAEINGWVQPPVICHYGIECKRGRIGCDGTESVACGYCRAENPLTSAKSKV